VEGPQLPPGLDQHVHNVLGEMRRGRVVPFLGAGVNLGHLPSGSELAAQLSSTHDLQKVGGNLLRVSQYVEVLVGRPSLEDGLHEVFTGEYGPTRVHEFLARVPEQLFRRQGLAPRYQLIVTTNYDDALEQAFAAAQEPYHVVWYVAEGDGVERGKFVHRPPGGSPVLVTNPSEYVEVSTSESTVILKIHGAVDRAAVDSEADSYVITEDDYIEYLTGGTELASFVPIQLVKPLKESSFLFLGYRLGDWNLRVILNRIWREQGNRKPVSWAIQREPPDELDEDFWNRKSVKILGVDLDTYVDHLERRMAS
jgi:hypothetical protein